MEPIVIGQSRKRWLILLIVALTFVALGVLLLAAGRSGFIPWMAIVFFGGCAVMFARQLFDRRPRITIDDRGIDDRFLKIGLIDWDDIEGVHLWRQQGNPFLALELRDQSKYVDRLSPLMRRMVAVNEKLGYPGLNLNLAGTDAVPEEVEKEIGVRVQKHHSNAGRIS